MRKSLSDLSWRRHDSWSKMQSFFLTTVLALFLVITAQAEPVRVYTFDSQGNPIAGTYKVQLGPNFIGTYNSGDTANLTAGLTYQIHAIYDFTSTERVDLTVSAGGDSLAFNTTNVKIHFSGGYLNYRGSGSWKSFGKDSASAPWNDRELFPYDFYGDTMKIQTGYKWNDVRGMIFDLYYAGQTSVEKTIAIIQVKDNAGVPIAGATARGGYTNPTSWHVAGSTNANGLLLDLRNGNVSSLAYEARVNATTATEGPKNPQTDSYYLFQTELVTHTLQSCTASPLQGGLVRFGNDSVYVTRWFPNNPGIATDSTGTTSGQMFPGTYSFEMQYKGTSDRKIAVTVPLGGASFVWNTVTVSFNYAGSISYGGSTGDSRFLDRPEMELLPGSYIFHFRGSHRDTLTLTGCEFKKSVVLVDVLDCNGQNQPGVDVQWYKYGQANNKVAAGTTGAGSHPILVDNNAVKIGVVVNYLGQSNLVVQSIDTNATVTFQMIDVALELYNYDSTATLTPQAMQFYVYGQANNKMTFPVSQNMCLLPGHYGFVVKYNETSQNRNQIDVEVENPVIFRTGLIDDLDACSFSPTTYYQYGSANNTFAFADPMEFMPSKVGVKSSVNPVKMVTVQAGGVHRLDSCANQVIADSCVSDSGWAMSTVITPSNLSGYWYGVAELPHDSTFSLEAEVGQPYHYGGINVLPGTLPIKAPNNITYYRKKFGLTDTIDVDARFRMYMDDACEIYINGQRLAREEKMSKHNYRGVPHDILFNADNTYNNGYLGGDMFDDVVTVNLDTILRKESNDLVIVLRNPSRNGNKGGFSFRMDISKNGQSVLVKKNASSTKENRLLVAYPNPVTNVLFVEPTMVSENGNNELSVFNMSGQVVATQVLTPNQDRYEINLEHLNAGIYFVRFVDGQNVQYAKIIKN